MNDKRVDFCPYCSKPLRYGTAAAAAEKTATESREERDANERERMRGAQNTWFASGAVWVCAEIGLWMLVRGLTGTAAIVAVLIALAVYLIGGMALAITCPEHMQRKIFRSSTGTFKPIFAALASFCAIVVGSILLASTPKDAAKTSQTKFARAAASAPVPDGGSDSYAAAVAASNSVCWFDLLGLDEAERANTDALRKPFSVPEFPEIELRWYGDTVTAKTGKHEHTIAAGTAIENAYFIDLNNDGYRELCMSVRAASGYRIEAVDLKNSTSYTLVDRQYYDYTLNWARSADLGGSRLTVHRTLKSDPSQKPTDGNLLLSADGELYFWES